MKPKHFHRVIGFGTGFALAGVVAFSFQAQAVDTIEVKSSPLYKATADIREASAWNKNYQRKQSEIIKFIGSWMNGFSNNIADNLKPQSFDSIGSYQDTTIDQGLKSLDGDSMMDAVRKVAMDLAGMAMLGNLRMSLGVPFDKRGDMAHQGGTMNVIPFNEYEAQWMAKPDLETFENWELPEGEKPLTRLVWSRDYKIEGEDGAFGYIGPGGLVEVPDNFWNPPYYLPRDARTVNGRDHHLYELAIRVSQKLDADWANRRFSRKLERMINQAAGALFPETLLKRFQPQTVVNHLLNQDGIRPIGNGVILRPAAKLDDVFETFVGLKNRKENETLFWSDPMVVEGYHPYYGDLLNKTVLKGYRLVDMDSVVSHGWSGRIDRWNRAQPAVKRIKNPFRGYASKIIPGLIAMGKQGRLTPSQDPTLEQLREAEHLSEELRLLPSQNIDVQTVSTGFGKKLPADRVVTSSKTPARAQAVLVYNKDYIPQIQGVVPMSELDGDRYIHYMEGAYYRLSEIHGLKKANRKAQEYLNSIIESYKYLDGELKGIADGIVSTMAISPLDDPGDNPDPVVPVRGTPEVVQMRQAVAEAITMSQERISDLRHSYDDLKQMEWEVLESINQRRKQAVENLMENAPIRYRTALMTEAWIR